MTSVTGNSLLLYEEFYLHCTVVELYPSPFFLFTPPFCLITLRITECLYVQEDEKALEVPTRGVSFARL